MFDPSFFYQAQPVGILVPQSRYPRLPGDAANASTWPFRVCYHVVKSPIGKTLIERDLTEGELEHFLLAAKALEERGVRVIAIAGDCLTPYHKHFSSLLKVPFVSSAMQMAPFAARMTGQRGVAVVTDSAARYVRTDYTSIGVKKGEFDLQVYELGTDSYYSQVFWNNQEGAETENLEAEMRALALKIAQNPNNRAVVLEAANLAPWSTVFTEVTGLPVINIVNTVRMVASATMRRAYGKNLWRGVQP